jgi:large subunit ribosomal protein L25
MATHQLNVELREVAGKGASRRLRHADKVPAIVYGSTLKPVAIQLNHEDVRLASQHEWFYASILDLNLNGEVQQVLLRDMQRHPAKPRILHLDFQRVMPNEAIRLSVPLHFLNAETSPAGKTGGVVITHELNEVEVSCLPGNLPEFIAVDLAELKEGDVVHLSSIKLPEGVTIPSLKLGADHDIAVVIARKGRVEEEEVAAPASADVPATKAAKAAAAPAKAAPASKK